MNTKSKKKDYYPEILTGGQVCDTLRIGQTLLRNAIYEGRFPKSAIIMIGKRAFYLSKEVKKIDRNTLFRGRNDGGRLALKPLSPRQEEILIKYLKGELHSREISEELEIHNKQRVCQVMQSYAYRKLYFEVNE